MDIAVWLRSLGPVRPSRPSARPPEHAREPDFGGRGGSGGLLGWQEDPRAETALIPAANPPP